MKNSRRKFLAGAAAAGALTIAGRSANAVWPYVPGGSFNSDLNVNTEWFNIVSFGAIGDGASHPASGVYGSMAALLVAYPFATGVTNELNWLAVQAALLAAAAAGGGVVFVPYGTFVMTNANSALDGSGTLGPLPDAQSGFPQFAVSILGVEGGSILYWANDLGMPTQASFTGVISTTTLTTSGVTNSIIPGQYVYGGTASETQIVRQLTGTPNGAGTYLVSPSQTVGSQAMHSNFVSNPNIFGRRLAIICGDYKNDFDDSPGYFQDLMFQGPGQPGPPGGLGSATTQMIGIGTNDRREMTRVYSTGFYAGVLLVGGQTRWQECYFNNNFYGVHQQFPTQQFGNMQWDRCDFSTNRMAGLATEPSHSLDSILMNACVFDTQPYGIFKEWWTPAFIAAEFGPDTFNNVGILNGCLLNNCQFENCGNAAIGDGLPAPVTFTGSISGTTLTTSGSPAIKVGMQLVQAVGGPAVLANTYVTVVGGANSFTVNLSQTVASGSIIATRSSAIINTRINSTQMGWWNTGGAAQANVQISTLPHTGLISVGTANGLIIDQPIQTFQWAPGTDSIFDISSIAAAVGIVSPTPGFSIRGDIGKLIQNCAAATLGGSGFFGNNSFITPGSVEIDNEGFWKGTVTAFAGYGSTALGSVVQYDSVAGPHLCAGANTDNVQGILVYNSTWGLLANEGIVPVASASNVFGAGNYARTSTTGTVIAATSHNDTTSVVIGYAVSVNSAGFTAIRLQGIK